ncbi:hypothetical protein [Streptomyces acidiscabies]|uniref:hypothetical protein n=1 Tax=Streptomyces acidiscabies TaxID=42234 RepID=UPI000952C1DA|nr:hypothetical protein [Streptomyces acidiscabies]
MTSPAELAQLLRDAADEVSNIPVASYPTPPSRSYLHPVLGPLAAGPRVAAYLGERLDVLAERPPQTPASLFALASLASALGWFTESLSTFVRDVDAICTRAGLPAVPEKEYGPLPAPASGLSGVELASVRAAAALCGLSPARYADVLAAALRAGGRIDAECSEIAEGLREDAAQVADRDTRPGDGPDHLPGLVRTLLARTETPR